MTSLARRWTDQPAGSSRRLTGLLPIRKPCSRSTVQLDHESELQQGTPVLPGPPRRNSQSRSKPGQLHCTTLHQAMSPPCCWDCSNHAISMSALLLALDYHMIQPHAPLGGASHEWHCLHEMKQLDQSLPIFTRVSRRYTQCSLIRPSMVQILGVHS